MSDETRNQIEVRVAIEVAQHLNREVLSQIHYQTATDSAPDTNAVGTTATTSVSPRTGIEAMETIQLEWERKEAVDELEPEVRRLQPPSPEIEQALGALRTAPTIAQVRTLRMELRQEVQRVAESQDNDKNINNAELMQEAQEAQLRAEITQLWKNVKKDEKDVAGLMKEAWDSKDPNSEEGKAYEEWFKKRAEILAMSDDDPKKAELLAKLERQAGRMLRQEADRDEARGDHTNCIRRREGANKSDNAANTADEIRTKSEELHKQKNEYNGRTAHKGMHLSEEDDQFIAKNRTKKDAKLAVSDANLNEIETPDGGKHRAASRILVKS